MLTVFSILFYFRPFSPHFWGVVTYTSGSSIIYSVYIYMHLYLGAWLSWLLMQSGELFTQFPVCAQTQSFLAKWCQCDAKIGSFFPFSFFTFLFQCSLLSKELFIDESIKLCMILWHFPFFDLLMNYLLMGCEIAVPSSCIEHHQS